MMSRPLTKQERATKLIEELGERPTLARIQVLAALLSQNAAVAHHEIEATLGSEKIDRVTLYRVLDWLVEHHLAHRVTSEDRVWHFLASNKNVAAQNHAHFQCTNCNKVVCLEDVPVQRKLPVPSGYKMQEVELTVKGKCDRCS